MKHKSKKAEPVSLLIAEVDASAQDIIEQQAVALLLKRLDETDAAALKTVLTRVKESPLKAIADLLHGPLKTFAESQRLEKTRSVRMNRVYVSNYAQVLTDYLKTMPIEHRWILLDFSKGTLCSSHKHPGNRKDNQALDAWPREEWQDLKGNITLRSVKAWLLGYPRPDGESTI